MASAPTELERFRDFINEKLDNGGVVLSPEDVLRQFRRQRSNEARTPLGTQLRELRQKILDAKQPLLSLAELDAEVAQRRGESSEEELS